MSAILKILCQRCGFVPADMCQLDAVDIVGRGTDPDNIVTLCVNCQRLKEEIDSGCISPAELEDLKGIWRHGILFN